MVNLPASTPAKPKKLLLELKCQSNNHAMGMRQVLREILFEYKYHNKDFEFKIK